MPPLFSEPPSIWSLISPTKVVKPSVAVWLAECYPSIVLHPVWVKVTTVGILNEKLSVIFGHIWKHWSTRMPEAKVSQQVIDFNEMIDVTHFAYQWVQCCGWWLRRCVCCEAARPHLRVVFSSHTPEYHNKENTNHYMWDMLNSCDWQLQMPLTPTLMLCFYHPNGWRARR